MKVRIGFVSNSSSCSFMCDICGRQESGWEMSLSEARMSECVNHHVFCDKHTRKDVFEDVLAVAKSLNEHPWAGERTKELIAPLLEAGDKEGLEKLFSGELEPHYDEYVSLREGVPAVFCPACSLEAMIDRDLIMYFLADRGQSRTEVMRAVKERFHDYDGLRQFFDSAFEES